MIISFVNQKGGVGKTTISVNVAACLVRQGYKVVLIDADKQATSSTWASLRDENPFPVVAMPRENMAREAIELSRNYDFTIIDAPPHAEAIMRACIIAADFVIMPIEPSGPSAWAKDETVKQIQQAATFKETLKRAFVVSRKIGNTVIGRDIRGMVEDSGIPVLKTDIEQRVAQAEALTLGKTIFEYGAKGAKEARDEIEALTKEIMTHEQIIYDSTEAKTAHG